MERPAPVDWRCTTGAGRREAAPAQTALRQPAAVPRYARSSAGGDTDSTQAPPPHRDLGPLPPGGIASLDAQQPPPPSLPVHTPQSALATEGSAAAAPPAGQAAETSAAALSPEVRLRLRLRLAAACRRPVPPAHACVVAPVFQETAALLASTLDRALASADARRAEDVRKRLRPLQASLEAGSLSSTACSLLGALLQGGLGSTDGSANMQRSANPRSSVCVCVCVSLTLFSPANSARGRPGGRSARTAGATGAPLWLRGEARARVGCSRRRKLSHPWRCFVASSAMPPYPPPPPSRSNPLVKVGTAAVALKKLIQMASL